MIAVLQNRADTLPDMGGQKQQAPHQEDKQKDVSADEADTAQPNPEISGEKEVPSGSCATENTDENEASFTSRKKKKSPSVGSEPAAKKRKMAVPTHADLDMSEVEEDGKDTDSVIESDEWSPSQETDSFVELVFRKVLTKAQREKLLKDYPKPSTDAAHVPVLDSSIRAAYYQMQPADSQLYKAQRVVLDAANPLIKAFDLLQQKPDSLDIAEVSKAVKSSLQLLGGANAHLTTERRKGALSKMKPQWAHLAKEKFPEAKRNLFEEVVERRAKSITALKKATTLGGSNSFQQNFRSSAQSYRPFRQGTTRNQSCGWLPKSDGVFGRLDGPSIRGRSAARYWVPAEEVCTTGKYGSTIDGTYAKKDIHQPSHKSCRKAETICTQLAADKQRQVGTSSHFRIPNRILPVSLPAKLSSSSSFCKPTGSHHLGRSRSYVGQRSHRRLYRRHLLRQIHLKHLPCSQARREVSSCHQFKKAQSICHTSALQNGRATLSTQSAPGKRFHGKNRLIGRVFQFQSVSTVKSFSDLYGTKESTSFAVYHSVYRQPLGYSQRFSNQ